MGGLPVVTRHLHPTLVQFQYNSPPPNRAAKYKLLPARFSLLATEFLSNYRPSVEPIQSSCRGIVENGPSSSCWVVLNRPHTSHSAQDIDPAMAEILSSNVNYMVRRCDETR